MGIAADCTGVGCVYPILARGVHREGVSPSFENGIERCS
jgi:hypothetical protein